MSFCLFDIFFVFVFVIVFVIVFIIFFVFVFVIFFVIFFVIDDTNLSLLSSVRVIRRPGDPSLLAGFDEPRLGPALEEGQFKLAFLKLNFGPALGGKI